MFFTEQIAEDFRRLEEQIERTSEMYRQLVRAQGDPIRLDYPSGPRYMCLKRQRDRNDRTIGVYWQAFQEVKTGGKGTRKIWKKGWHPKKVPPTIIKKMDESNLSWFREQNDIAKAIHSARNDLLRKKRSIQATLQNFKRDVSSSSSRMGRAEELYNDFVL